MVQNGKLATGTVFLVIRLNRDDLPALGRPTSPTESIEQIRVMGLFFDTKSLLENNQKVKQNLKLPTNP